MTISRNRLVAAGALCVAVLLVGLILIPTTGKASAADRHAQVAAAAALSSGLTCTKTDKTNGGFILDCDPAGTTPSPTASASASPSPSASASTSPSPSPSTSTTTTPPAGGNNCIANPSRCGFPDATNTGVPAGTTLTPSGGLTIRAANTIIDGRLISGCVRIEAANVIIRNSRIAADCFWGVYVAADSRGQLGSVSIVDSEIDCLGGQGTGAGPRNVSINRVDISRCANGLHGDGNIAIRDSYIHDLITSDGAHADGIQLGQRTTDISIDHSTLITPSTGGGTSAIIMWVSDTASSGFPNARIYVRNSLLAGGAYAIYCPRQTAQDIVITGNRVGRGAYGTSSSCRIGGVTWSNNVNDATGAALAAA